MRLVSNTGLAYRLLYISRCGNAGWHWVQTEGISVAVGRLISGVCRLARIFPLVILRCSALRTPPNATRQKHVVVWGARVVCWSTDDTRREPRNPNCVQYVLLAAQLVDPLLVLTPRVNQRNPDCAQYRLLWKAARWPADWHSRTGSRIFHFMCDRELRPGLDQLQKIKHYDPQNPQQKMDNKKNQKWMVTRRHKDSVTYHAPSSNQ